MSFVLEDHHLEHQAEFKAFTAEKITPFADEWDRKENLPKEVVKLMAEKRYLSSFLSKDKDGLGGDLLTFSILNEEVGRGCSSARSLLTVHGMVLYGLMRWGSRAHKSDLVPILARGEKIGAFALTEPGAGSDAKGLSMEARREDTHYVLNGIKRWITFGALADVYLVFAQQDGKPIAFLVERETEGLEVEPTYDMLGTRAAMLATLKFNNCQVPKENMVGGPGFGFSAVALSALNLGRLSVGTGSVGIVRACMEDSMAYANSRNQFDTPIKNHQLVREMLTNMIVDYKAARLLALSAGYAEQTGDPHAMREILKAKYFASRAAARAASDAVQIHGAIGCSNESSVSRYLRDAKIMEIIEGSTQMQQIMIPKFEYETFLQA